MTPLAHQDTRLVSSLHLMLQMGRVFKHGFPNRSMLLSRLLPAVFLLLGLGLFFWLDGSQWLNFYALVEHHKTLKSFVDHSPLISVMVFFIVYAAAVSFSVPGAAMLTISGGFLFGFLLGGSASVGAATLGALVVFLIARATVTSLPIKQERLEKLRSGFEKNAFHYLLFLRLVPVFPFWLVNVAPAFLNVRVAVYLAATILGILPGTFAFALFGSGLENVLARQQALYDACRDGPNPQSCVFEFSLSSFVSTPFLVGLAALGLVCLVPVFIKRRES